MIHSVIIPQLGATGGDVKIVEWLVREGQQVKTGDVMFVVETDKATDDVPAFRDGFVRRILAAVDEEKAPGDVVALLTDTADEAIETPCSTGDELVPMQAALQPPTSPTKPAANVAGSVAATPRARKLAKNHGIHLGSLRVTSGHTIQVSDVEAAIQSQQSCESTNSARRKPLSAVRRAIAERTRQSKSEIPHFYLSVDVDVTELEAKRQELKHAAHGPSCPSVNDCVIAAAARALRNTPDLNAVFQGDEIILFEDVDVGLVVGLNDGVVVPLLRRADTLTLTAITEATRELRRRAMAWTLTTAELTGGALTVSNLGMCGVDSFTAVISPGQSIMLGCGAARERPAVVEGKIVIRKLMTTTLSVDHRLTDGMPAALFMQRFKTLLEQPAQLFETSS